MYSIIDLSGQQYKVSPGDKIRVQGIDSPVETELNLDKVLLFADGKDISIGQPYVADAAAKARVTAHAKEDKVLIFKHKRRKDYHKKTGHRQPYTELLITEVAMGRKKEKYAEKKPKAKAKKEE